jgi:hypothetical protein
MARAPSRQFAAAWLLVSQNETVDDKHRECGFVNPFKARVAGPSNWPTKRAIHVNKALRYELPQRCNGTVVAKLAIACQSSDF